MPTFTHESLRGLSAFITGGSRGIGLEIACKLAAQGVNVAIAAKTVEPHPKLEGTIHTAKAAIEGAAQFGARALALQMDVREEDQVQAALEATAEAFGGIDLVINNASAIALQGTEAMDMKRFDLIQQINTRGTFMVSKLALPWLKASRHGHILALAPPLNLAPHWFGPHLGYSLGKYGMSLCILGLAEELKGAGIAANALWPRTLIATAAVSNIVGSEATFLRSRKPAIMADAAVEILARDPRQLTGNFFIDDDVLSASGVTDFSPYRCDPNGELQLDMFLEPEMPLPQGSDLKGHPHA